VSQFRIKSLQTLCLCTRFISLVYDQRARYNNDTANPSCLTTIELHQHSPASLSKQDRRLCERGHSWSSASFWPQAQLGACGEKSCARSKSFFPSLAPCLSEGSAAFRPLSYLGTSGSCEAVAGVASNSRANPSPFITRASAIVEKDQPRPRHPTTTAKRLVNPR